MLRRLITAVMAVSVLTFAAAGFAQEKNIARSFKITPLPGHAKELDKKFAEHAKWRKEHNDPWGWNVYQEAAGGDLMSWYVRSGGHNWADFDIYDADPFQAEASKHWMDHVAPHVGSMSSSISESMPEISNWPEDPSNLTIFNVINFQINQGQAQLFELAAAEIVAVLMSVGWEESWGFGQNLTGPDPSYYLVLPEANWTGYTPGEMSVFDMLAEATDLETAAQLFADFNATIKKADSTYYRLNTELSYSGAE